MESVKICHFKTFRAGNFASRTFCCSFLHYVHVKKFVCHDISAEYEFESEKFKGGTHRQGISKHYRRAHVHIEIYCHIVLYIRDGVCQNLSF